MSTPMPMTHDCCWERPDCCRDDHGYSLGSSAGMFLAAVPRGAATLWHAFARWQGRKLEQRLAALQPDSRWLD